MEEFIPITLFICVAAVAILRPMTKRVGGLLEAVTQEKLREQQPVSDPRTTLLLERLSQRLDLIEERLDFTERLLTARRRETSLAALESTIES